MACAFAGAPARAETARFDISQFFATGSAGAMTITGTFTGEFENGRITRISDMELFRNGVAFRGNGSLYTAQYDSKTRSWIQGGYLSLDGSANNIMFVDSDYGGGDAGFYNYFYSVTGMGNAAFLPSYYRYQVADASRLFVRQQLATVPGVPEPSTWVALVLGFGALGAAMRRRPALRAHLA